MRACLLFLVERPLILPCHFADVVIAAISMPSHLPSLSPRLRRHPNPLCSNPSSFANVVVVHAALRQPLSSVFVEERPESHGQSLVIITSVHAHLKSRAFALFWQVSRLSPQLRADGALIDKDAVGNLPSSYLAHKLTLICGFRNRPLIPRTVRP